MSATAIVLILIGGFVMAAAALNWEWFLVGFGRVQNFEKSIGGRTGARVVFGILGLVFVVIGVLGIAGVVPLK